MSFRAKPMWLFSMAACCRSYAFSPDAVLDAVGSPQFRSSVQNVYTACIRIQFELSFHTCTAELNSCVTAPNTCVAIRKHAVPSGSSCYHGHLHALETWTAALATDHPTLLATTTTILAAHIVVDGRCGHMLV